MRPTKKAFAEWLDRQPPARGFDRMRFDTCPVACWLRETGHPDAEVQTREWTLDGRRISVMPPWARRVVIKVDGAPVYTVASVSEVRGYL